MSFGDDVRGNYKPKIDSSKGIDHVRNECAKILVDEAKNRLMDNAEDGRTQQISVGFFGKKIKAVTCSFPIMISPFNKVSIGYTYPEYGQEDRQPESLYVPNEKEAKAVFSIIQQICSKEGIQTERYSGYKMSDKANIRFWIEL